MKKLNQYLFKKRVEKHLQEPHRNKRYVDYDSAGSVLLLFESDFIEKNRFIRKAISQLTADGKRVTAWGFLDKKHVNTAILPNFRILDEASIDWFKRPKKNVLTDLASDEFDLLIDLTLKDHLPLLYVSLYANAAFKTGLSRPLNENVLDFRIQLTTPEIEVTQEEVEENKIEFEDLNESLFHTDQQFLFEQIIYYLKKIQTKD